MITSSLLLILYGIVFTITSPIRLLPNVSLPDNIISSISSGNNYIAAIYLILPYTIAALLIALGIVITIEGFILLFKIMNWLIRKIPTIS